MKVSLKAMRVNCGLTQKEAAKSLKIAEITLLNWEKYKSAPNVLQFKKICDLYKCGEADIFIPTTLSKTKQEQE